MALRNVLITGVSGFIGRALVREFHLDRSVRIFGHSRDLQKSKQAFDGFNIEFLTSVDAEQLNERNIHTIIHLAGIAHDLKGRYEERDYFEVNDKATRKLYDVYLKSNVSRFIFLSSIKAAVDTSPEAVDETVTPHPSSPYGKSKLEAERYIQECGVFPGKYYYILRPCMVHGPGNKGNLNLLYKFVRAGLPFPFGSFSNQRSFLGIDNLTYVIRQCIETDLTPGIYHLADDDYIATKDLYQLIASSIGQKGRVWHLPKGLVTALFSMIGRRQMLTKLTEDMMVSNKKITAALKAPMPFALRAGLEKTIKSFNER